MFRKKRIYILIIIFNILLLFLFLTVFMHEEEYVYLSLSLSQNGLGDVSIVQMDCELNTESKVGQESIFSADLQSDFWGNGKYFFLPESVDLSDVIIIILSDEQNESKISFDGVEVERNEKVNIGLLEEGSHVITVNGTNTYFEILRGSKIPTVSIETTEGMDYIFVNKENMTTGEIKILDSGGDIQYKGSLEKLSGRGNSTWSGKKKSFGIKLEEADQLLGMTPGKSWVLQGGGFDVTTIRNKIFLDMANKCELDNAIESEWVNLYIDNRYYGCYLLTEKITIANGRLEIGNLEEETEKINERPLNEYAPFYYSEPISQKGYLIPNNPESIEGGYLLEVEIYPDRYNEEGSGFTTQRGISVVIKDPEYATEEQVQYISAYVQEFEDALYSENGYNFQEKSIKDYIDMESFSARYIIDEFSKNIDAGYSSYFMYKPSNESKLYAGPVWDYDTALGNNNGWGDTEVLKNPEGLYVNTSLWSLQFWKNDEFKIVTKEIYQSSFQEYFKYMSGMKMDQYVHTIYDSLVMNSVLYQDDNLDEEIDFLLDYVAQREKYFDEVFLEELSR